MTDENTEQSGEMNDESVPATAETMVEADPIAEANAKAVEAQDRLLRMAAEFENFRKRAAREREEALRNGIERVVNKLLPVVDSFEMAMAATMGSGVPLKNGPTSMVITPPESICSMPPSEEASPAMSP